MYTLKIRWMRYEQDLEYAEKCPEASPQYDLADENTLFIPADLVSVGSEIKLMSEMNAWESGSFLNYTMPFNNDPQWVMKGTRLIQVVRDGKDTWYLASLAWLLGPDGKTIEKLTTTST